MAFTNRLRNKAFWLLDTFKGSPVKKHFNEVRVILGYDNWNQVRQYHKIKISELTQHAIRNIPFYSNLNTDRLEDFPVVFKRKIVENYEEFYAENYLKEKYWIKSTSGSTGEPFDVRQNNLKINRNIADTLYFSKRSGYQLGSSLFYIRFWDELLRKSGLQAKIQNVVQIEITELDDRALNRLCQQLSRNPKRTKGLLGYASGFDLLIRYLEDQHVRFDFSGVKSAIAMAEALSPITRDKFKSYFDVPLLSRYSNTENGIIAQQIPGTGTDFIINWASYYIEILDFNSDTPVQNGQQGRIVITDLFNYAMPLIRYDTGDVGTMEVGHDGIPLLSTIEGRLHDTIYDTKGNIISSFIPSYLERYKGIIEYQFLQTGKKEYTINLIINDQFSVEKEIIEFMKSHFGADAELKINYIDSIPLLSSGKRKKVLNTFKNPMH